MNWKGMLIHGSAFRSDTKIKPWQNLVTEDYLLFDSKTVSKNSADVSMAFAQLPCLTPYETK
jgi:hypothetical protein